MKIECILKRKEGTKAEIGGLEYFFKPLDDGAHVAEVANTAHIDRFLSIPEAYKVYHGELEAAGQPVPVAPPSPVLTPEPAAKPMVGLMGSSVHEATYEIGGQTVALGDVVRKAFETSNLTAEEWNDLEDADRHARLDIALDVLADQAEAAAGEPTREALAEQYKAKFGKAPHYRLSAEKIKAELAGE